MTMQQLWQTNPTLSATLLVQMLDGMLASFDQPLKKMKKSGNFTFFRFESFHIILNGDFISEDRFY